MKTDIKSREDLENIVFKFYQKLIKDEGLRPFFEDILKANTLDHHLSVIVDFWEDILFQTHQYQNNPIQKHIDVHQKMKFEKWHFITWLQYLFESIDEDFQGTKALEMKTRATSIATVMQLKMDVYST
jgi:hemoglobin